MRRSPAVLSLFFFQIPIWVFCYCKLTHVFGDWLKKQSRWRSNAHANIRPFYAIYGFDEERLAKVDLDKAWGGQVVLHENSSRIRWVPFPHITRPVFAICQRFNSFFSFFLASRIRWVPFPHVTRPVFAICQNLIIF